MSCRKPGTPEYIANKGFTLIEILVVISIIAVLVSILMPVLSAMKRAAWKRVCVSNLRQLGVAFQLYTNDWSGFFPAFRNDDAYDEVNKEDELAWTVPIGKNLDVSGKFTIGKRTHKIMKCRGDFDAKTNPWHDVSYAYNTQRGKDIPILIPFGIRGKVIVLVDGRTRFSIDDQDRGSGVGIYYRHDTRKSDNCGPAAVRVKGSANTLFADMHVENLGLKFPIEDSMIEW